MLAKAVILDYAVMRRVNGWQAPGWVRRLYRRPALIACALCVAASRMLLGMHFLTDVVAGSALGMALGYGAWLLAR